MPDNESAVKANLKVQLLANDLVVAESEDKQLWSKVFSAITSGTSLPGKLGDANDMLGEDEVDPEDAVSQFAAALNLKPKEVVAACAPQAEAPYLHLDKKYWAALKANTPKRGPKAIGPMVLSATGLALWADHLKPKPAVTPSLARDVLTLIDVEDKNPSRALSNCEWLQVRSGTISINPIQIHKAEQVFKAYCTKTKPEYNSE